MKSAKEWAKRIHVMSAIHPAPWIYERLVTEIQQDAMAHAEVLRDDVDVPAWFCTACGWDNEHSPQCPLYIRGEYTCGRCGYQGSETPA